MLQILQYISVDCLFVCLSWEQWFVYVFKVSVRNFMVKQPRRSASFIYVLFLEDKGIAYVGSVFTCKSELQGLFIYNEYNAILGVGILGSV